MLTVMNAVVVLAVGRAIAQTVPLPPGHPPTGAQKSPPPGAAPSIVTPPPGSGTGSRALVWTPPSGWTAETPSSAMRRAQYRISGPGGAAECVVFYFGPGEGGDAKKNVERWAGQFRSKDGKSVSDQVKTRNITVGGIAVTLVEVSGTYVGGMGGMPAAGERPNHMLLGAIAKGPDADWYFRAIGPRATMEPQRASFERMMRSIKRGQGP
jgi:hypothetical protein